MSKRKGTRKLGKRSVPLAKNQNAKGKASVKEMLAIARRAAAHKKGPLVDHAEYLYDENGLPK